MNEAPSLLHVHWQQRVDALAADNDLLTALLSSADIPIVLVDTELRIMRFTPAASRVLTLQASDNGRSIDDVSSKVIGADLSHHARAALHQDAPVEKVVTGLDGRRYLFRGLPYRIMDETRGMVITLIDVTGVRPSEESLRSASDQVADDLRRLNRLHLLTDQLLGPGDLRSMLEHVLRATVEIGAADICTVQLRDRDAGLTLAAQVGVPAESIDFFARFDAWEKVSARSPSDRYRRVAIADMATSRPFSDTASEATLTAIGVRALQSTALFDRGGRCVGVLSTFHRARQRFDESATRWLDLLARHAVDVIERRRTEDLWTSAANHLQRRVTERTTWLVLMHDLLRAINAAPNGEEALRLVLHRICETGYWQLAYVYFVDRDDPDTIVPVISWAARERFRGYQLASPQRRDAASVTLPGRVFAEGAAVWVNGESSLLAALPSRAEAAQKARMKSSMALPITAGTEVVAVIELFSDQYDAPNQVLADLMNDVGVQIARIMQGERGTNLMVDFVRREHQALLQTLHDSLGQTLTGVGMLSAGLKQRLSAIDAGMATTAAQIAEQAQIALDQVRQIARGLVPLEIAPENLLAAIREFAASTESLYGIGVTVSGEAHGTIGNVRVATELFWIVQEAVTNVLKHAHATTIRIELHQRAGLVTLMVVDDGVGIPRDTSRSSGFGLRIMQERASSIGALISTAPSPLGGTVVTCLLRTPMVSEVEVN